MLEKARTQRSSQELVTLRTLTKTCFQSITFGNDIIFLKRPFLCAVRSAEIMEENLQQITAIPVLRRALQKTLTDLVYYKSRELKEEEIE
ncbi:hypothetical protein T4E_8060 [Trichinella pseudospiralis]|uniref:Uncharacterized protein n=1 Tax=Trichinella pseudospiralis TaxID=6337 RepID=A0A0V0XWF0_TRIPS|nr:hypothetical protein T4E_8060 [Trichinella pseudospiralis]